RVWIAEEEPGLIARARRPARDGHARDRDGRLARRAEGADRDHRTAAVDRRPTRTGADEAEILGDREPAGVGARTNAHGVARAGCPDRRCDLAARATPRTA